MMHSFGSYSMWGPTPFGGFAFLGVIGLLIGAVLLVLVLALKGYALWFAAKRDDKGWFVALLILNTAGILELIYLIFIVRRWPKIYNGPKTPHNNDHNNGPKAN